MTDASVSTCPDRPVSVCVLASGSRGNAIYVSDGATSILVDAGLSGVEIGRRMAARNLSPESLNAIIVTHEHTDHVQGVGVMSRKHKLPVFATSGTLKESAAKTGKLHAETAITCGEPFSVGSLSIHPFSISHDAADPCGFTIESNGRKIGIATDLGIVTGLVRTRLSGCSLLVMEANHDPHMLATGPYPWALKQRVKSRIGHLSNEESRDLILALAHEKLEHVIIGHLSEQNNCPNQAMAVVSQAVNPARTRLSLATQHEPGELIVSA